MRTKTKKAPALYTGESVKVKRGGKLVTGEVLEIAGDRFCIEYADGTSQWLDSSAVVR